MSYLKIQLVNFLGIHLERDPDPPQTPSYVLFEHFINSICCKIYYHIQQKYSAFKLYYDDISPFSLNCRPIGSFAA